jgi:hypothetical protein
VRLKYKLGSMRLGLCVLNTRYIQAVLFVASSLLASSCNRMGDPPRWWYSDHINRSSLCPTAYPRPPRAPGATARRGPEAIQQAIREHYARLNGCFGALLQTNREAGGKVQVRFTIAPDGSVTMPCIDEATTVDDQGLAECILAEFSAMKFVSDDDYGYVVVVYPILFVPR